ncbi:MAG TPA: carbon monoxide dehydrogenase, partial [Ktedonobacterales bacterium]|nr:carbon monoxide dehydrogenase [Ktedonobacterales bacterium]
MSDETPIRGMGHSVRRKEDARFLRGKGHYIDDFKLPGMLYMDIVRSPYAHATIKSIDASKALAIPGVLAVVTGKDLDAAGLAWMPTLMSDRQMVLPVDTVMYQSQEVAAVIAESRYAAADGAALVEVDYEPLEVIVDPFKALQEDAPILRPDREIKSNRIWHWEAGDEQATEQAIANAE